MTKAVTGETQGVDGGRHVPDHGHLHRRRGTYPFTLGVGETASTPDLPVGTSCTVTEDAAERRARRRLVRLGSDAGASRR